MPRTRKPKPTDIPEEALDHFAGPARLNVAGQCGRDHAPLQEAIVERILGGELTHHLGYPPGGAKPEATTNQRNGPAAGRC